MGSGGRERLRMGRRRQVAGLSSHSRQQHHHQPGPSPPPLNLRTNTAPTPHVMDPDLRVVPAAALIPAPAPQPRFNLPIQTLGPSPNSQPDPPEATTTSRAGWGGLEQSLVKRQDDLGWDDPLTCNVGVCLPENSYCTVFETRASAVGICCQK